MTFTQAMAESFLSVPRPAGNKKCICKILAFCPAVIVSSELISAIHTSHKFIVGEDTFRARYLDTTLIFLFPKNSPTSGRLDVGGHDHYLFPVHPSTRTHFSCLDCQ